VTSLLAVLGTWDPYLPEMEETLELINWKPEGRKKQGHP
jgi:hypothetical protein